MKIIKTIVKINLITIGIIISIYLLINSIYGRSININELFPRMHVVSIVVNIIFLPIYIIKALAATKKFVNEQYIDSKESIYTRDLPQEYNSVIAGELLDFKSNIKDEYVAGVIELISKGYIIEEQDALIVNNEKSTSELLKNEKYILETFTKFNAGTYLGISHIFLKKVREDMLDLGFYKNRNFFKKAIYCLEKCDKNNSNKAVKSVLTFTTLMVLGYLIFFHFKLTFLVLIIIYITSVILIRKNKLTEKGEREKENIGKLKLFFDRETSFKDKTKEERKIWGRYSAFAVALGINEELKKEIYDKYHIIVYEKERKYE